VARVVAVDLVDGASGFEAFDVVVDLADGAAWVVDACGDVDGGLDLVDVGDGGGCLEAFGDFLGGAA
jgi:hypothetical protein